LADRGRNGAGVLPMSYLHTTIGVWTSSSQAPKGVAAAQQVTRLTLWVVSPCLAPSPARCLRPPRPELRARPPPARRSRCPRRAGGAPWAPQGPRAGGGKTSPERPRKERGRSRPGALRPP